MAVLVAVCVCWGIVPLAQFTWAQYCSDDATVQIVIDAGGEGVGSEIWIASSEAGFLAHHWDTILTNSTYTGILELRKAADYDYTHDFLISYGNNVGSQIRIPNGELLLYKHFLGGSLTLTDARGTRSYSAFSETGEIIPIETQFSSGFYRSHALCALLLLLLLFLCSKNKKHTISEKEEAVSVVSSSSVTTATQGSRMHGLQLLRAVSCVSIVVAHGIAYAESVYDVPTCTFDYPTRWSMLQFARLFLALTGFLLVSEIKKGGSIGFFLKKKALRLYPGYWLALILCILLRVTFLQTVSITPQLWRAFLLLPGEIRAPYFLNGEWTLLCDVMYYLIAIPFFLPGLKKFFPAFLLSWLVAIVGFGHAQHPIFGIELAFSPFFFMTAHLSFISGCYARYVWDKYHTIISRIPQHVIALLSAVLLAAFLLTQDGATTWMSVAFSVTIGFFLLLCMAQLRVSPKNPLVWIGNRSYGIYLSHWTIFGIVLSLYTGKNIAFSITGYIGIVLITLVLSCSFGSVELQISVAVKKLANCKVPQKILLNCISIFVLCGLILFATLALVV